MPGKNRTGQSGTGPAAGKGGGQGGRMGRGGSGNQSGTGRGRMGGQGLGVGGECQCPNCGTRSPHTRGVPCFEQICPQCGSKMVRAS